MIFVDTNVLIDVIENDPVWADWSQRQLDGATAVGELAINDVIYAELAIGYSTMEDLDEVIAAWGLMVMPMSRLAAFIAGKAYQHYRAAGGLRTGVLPDFFIGAQALVEHAELITRDPRRYRTYFPYVVLIAPTPN